jgi:hypothetical protein
MTKIVVTMTEPDAFGHPIAGVRMLVVTEDGDRISIRTNDAGVASAWLRPGNYRLVNPDALEWRGNRYTWDFITPVRAGTPAIRLSQSNATRVVAVSEFPPQPTTAPIPTPTQPRPAQPSDLLAQAPRVLAPSGAETDRFGDGFFFALALNGSSFQVDDEDAGRGATRNGGGLNLSLGYYLTPAFGLVLNATGATMSTAYGDFTLGHGDIIGRYSFSAPNRTFVPHVELGLSALGVLSSEDDIELTGAGGTAGLGFHYFFSRKVALDLTFRYTVGELTTLRVGSTSISDEDGLGVRTGRFNLGVALFP